MKLVNTISSLKLNPYPEVLSGQSADTTWQLKPIRFHFSLHNGCAMGTRLRTQSLDSMHVSGRRLVKSWTSCFEPIRSFGKEHMYTERRYLKPGRRKDPLHSRLRRLTCNASEKPGTETSPSAQTQSDSSTPASDQPGTSAPDFSHSSHGSSSSRGATAEQKNLSTSDSCKSSSAEGKGAGFKLPPLPKRESIGERVLGALVNTTAAPVGSYVGEPITALHRLDPRVKQAWLVALVVLPMRSGLSVRLGIASGLAALTIASLPRPMWQDQLSRLALLCLFLFVGLAIGTDGVPPLVQPRSPPPALLGLPPLPTPAGGYRYMLFKLGPVQLTRRGLSLAAMSACLSFTVLQSASLCLSSTSPEQMAQALHWLLRPLALLGAPRDETVLTLLLSLRFVGLVFDEVRNLALGVVARGVRWKDLKGLGTVDVFVALIGRFFENLFNHAYQIGQAMVARDFGGNPERHDIYFLSKLSMKFFDWLALLALLVLVIVMNSASVTSLLAFS